jgi:hypothetical protein
LSPSLDKSREKDVAIMGPLGILYSTLEYPKMKYLCKTPLLGILRITSGKYIIIFPHSL